MPTGGETRPDDGCPWEEKNRRHHMNTGVIEVRKTEEQMQDKKD